MRHTNAPTDDYIICYGRVCFGFCHVDGDTATCPECGLKHILVDGKWQRKDKGKRKKESAKRIIGAFSLPEGVSPNESLEKEMEM